jgi:hypothetical protein
MVSMMKRKEKEVPERKQGKGKKKDEECRALFLGAVH